MGLFNLAKTRLNTLIATDQYKNSPYIIQQYNDSWALFIKDEKAYASVSRVEYQWTEEDNIVKHCLSNLSTILSIYHKRVEYNKPKSAPIIISY